jgi:uncharacterized protein (DUF2267 family)
MSTVGLESLDRSLQLTHEWINDLDDSLGWSNRHRSYRLLQAVLQVLRDCLPTVEAAHLAAQLPLLLRGVFYEHWRPGVEHPRHWDADLFFGKINAFFPNDPIDEADAAVGEVFRLLMRRIGKGEIDHVVGCLPRELRELWRTV